MTTDHELLSGIIAEYGQAMFNLGALPDEADDYREILARKIDIMRKEMYDRLQSLLSGGWQDISTAPKDGSDILILSNGCCVCGYWNSREGAFVTFQYGIYSPTHWMPLPLKPTGEL